MSTAKTHLDDPMELGANVAVLGLVRVSTLSETELTEVLRGLGHDIAKETKGNRHHFVSLHNVEFQLRCNFRVRRGSSKGHHGSSEQSLEEHLFVVFKRGICIELKRAKERSKILTGNSIYFRFAAGTFY